VKKKQQWIWQHPEYPKLTIIFMSFSQRLRK